MECHTEGKCNPPRIHAVHPPFNCEANQREEGWGIAKEFKKKKAYGSHLASERTISQQSLRSQKLKMLAILNSRLEQDLKKKNPHKPKEDTYMCKLVLHRKPHNKYLERHP